MHNFLKLDNISVSYFENTIIDSVNLSIEKGQFIGLVGSNGSGKTSLLKVIAGEKTANGAIVLDNENVSRLSVIQRLRKGLIYLHQNPIVFPDLSAWENFAIWKAAIENRSFLIADKNSTIDFLKAKLKQIGLKIPLEANVSELSEGDIQILEFLRVFLTEIKVLIIDEATSILNYSTSEKILKYLKSLTTCGASIIFVSHRVSEVKKYSDIVYSITNKTLKIYSDNEDPGQKHITVPTPRDVNEKDRQFLFTIEVAAENQKENLKIDLFSRQIIGISGLDGPNYESISRKLLKFLLNKKRPNGSRFRVGRDFAFLGKNRTTDWIFNGQTVGFNLSITKERRFIAAINNPAIDDAIEYFGVLPPDKNKKVDELSGGNKLKTAIGRTLSTNCSINVLDEPFTGIDNNARETIINIIRAEATNNKASFIILSKDYPVLLSFCDTLLAIKNDGTSNYFTSSEFPNTEFGLENILFNSDYAGYETN